MVKVLNKNGKICCIIRHVLACVRKPKIIKCKKTAEYYTDSGQYSFVK